MNCSHCTYALFEPLNVCLAPLNTWDKRRAVNISPTHKCHATEHFTRRTMQRNGDKAIDECKKILRRKK